MQVAAIQLVELHGAVGSLLQGDVGLVIPAGSAAVACTGVGIDVHGGAVDLRRDQPGAVCLPVKGVQAVFQGLIALVEGVGAADRRHEFRCGLHSGDALRAAGVGDQCPFEGDGLLPVHIDLHFDDLGNAEFHQGIPVRQPGLGGEGEIIRKILHSQSLTGLPISRMVYSVSPQAASSAAVSRLAVPSARTRGISAPLISVTVPLS